MFLLWFENVKFEFCVLDLFVIHYLEVAPTIGEEIIKSAIGNKVKALFKLTAGGYAKS